MTIPDPGAASPAPRRRGLVVTLIVVSLLAIVAVSIAAAAVWTRVQVDGRAPDGPRWAIDVAFSDLSEGTCLAGSYASGREEMMHAFSSYAATYQVVSCDDFHVAEVLSAVAVPGGDDWADYGLDSGPDAEAAASVRDAVCHAEELVLDDYHGFGAGSRSISIRTISVDFDQSVLGFCVAYDPGGLGAATGALLHAHAAATGGAPAAGPTAPGVAGDCLATHDGGDIDLTSVVDCTQPHEYDLVGFFDLDPAAGSTAADYDRLRGLGQDVEADTSWWDAIEPACWDAAGRAAGLPEVQVGDLAVQARPAGVALDISLPRGDDFLAGSRQVSCSVLWLDTDGDPARVVESQAGLHGMYQPGGASRISGCYVDAVDWLDAVECVGPHRLQEVGSFDAAVFGAGWMDAVREAGGLLDGPQADVDAACGQLTSAVLGADANDLLALTGSVDLSAWPAAGAPGPAPVDCALLHLGAANGGYATGDWLGSATSGPRVADGADLDAYHVPRPD